MQDKKKCLIVLSPYPNGGAPSQRFRFEQYLDYLSSDFNITQHSFWNDKSNGALYLSGKKFIKIYGVIQGVVLRFYHLLLCIKADVILIHREVVPIGSSFFEWFLVKILRKKIIFDFDDAIWLPNISTQNKNHEWLKNYSKTKKIISLSTTVIVGNNYLKKYALNYNKHVVVIPTTINTNYHLPNKSNLKSICIGWTGSKTTVKYFEQIIPVLKKIKAKYGNQVYFKLIGDDNFSESNLNLKGSAWKLESEISDLQEFDIGIMPLPDDEWAKGKCGFKGLQYMALEIPAILSPVGVNSEIISDGINGFLASSDEEWFNKLSLLIDSEKLRKELSVLGRQTVLDKYSVEKHKEQYRNILDI